MAQAKGTGLKVTTGAVVAGVAVGAGYGGYRLQQWSKSWDHAAEKGAAYADPGAVVAPELLKWQEVGRMQTGLMSVKSFAILKDGGVIVAGERMLRVLSGSGAVVRDIPLEGVPQAVAVMETAEGMRVFAGMKDHVEVFELSGTPLGKWPGFGAEAFVTCLTAGASGKTLWVADAGRRVVSELDLSGKVLREIGREDAAKHAPGLVIPSAHLDVMLAADGTAWISNPGRHELEAYDAQGVMVRQWGEAGTDIGRFTGCCNPTDFFLLDGGGNGRIVTAEKGTPRVKVFDASGNLQSVVTADFAPDAAGIDVAADGAGRVWVLDPVGREVRLYAPKTGN